MDYLFCNRFKIYVCSLKEKKHSDSPKRILVERWKGQNHPKTFRQIPQRYSFLWLSDLFMNRQEYMHICSQMGS